MVIHDNTREIHRAPGSEATITANVRALNHASTRTLPALFSRNRHAFHGGVHAPFYDGNGRFGRYLLASHMVQVLSHLTALTLPSTLNLHKERYYKAFSDAEESLNHGEVTIFACLPLNWIEKAQEYLEKELATRYGALVSLNERINKLHQDREWLRDKAEKVRRRWVMLEPSASVRASQYFPCADCAYLERAAGGAGVTAPTLRDRLKLLQGLGLVEGVKAGRTMRWSLTEAGTALLSCPPLMTTKNSPRA